MNIITQCCGLSLLIALTIFINSQKRLKLYREHIFRFVLGITFASIVCDILSVIFITNQSSLPRTAVDIICKLYVVTLSWDGWIAFVYMLWDAVNRKLYTRLVGCLALFNLIVSILSFFLPIEIVYNGLNVLYTQGSSTLVIYGSAAIHSALILFTCFTQRKRMNRRMRLSMILWVVFLVSAAAIQFIFKEVLIISFAMSLGVLIMFVLIENPESNMDKRLGCFNSYAKSIFIAALWEDNKPFSFLKIYFSRDSMTGLEESDRLYALQHISELLNARGRFYVFKENDSSFSIISTDSNALEEHAVRIWEMICNHDLSRGHTTLMLLNDPRLLKNVDEVDNIFSFALEDGLASPFIVNTIDENIVRLFRLKRLLTEDTSASDANAEDVAFLKNREERLKSLEIIDVFASEYSAVFHVNTINGALTPYALNGENISNLSKPFKKGMPFREAYSLFIDRFVYNDDKEMFRSACTLENIKAQLQEQRSYSIIFLFLPDADKEPIYCEMKFMKIGSENEELTSFVLGIANRDDKVKKEKAESLKSAQYHAVIQALASEYGSIYYANLGTDFIIPYATSTRVSRYVGEKALHGLHFIEAVDAYVNSVVAAEDKELMRSVLTSQNIRSELTNQQYFTQIYHNDVGQYCEMKCVRTDDLQPVESIVVGFAVKDTEMRRRLAQEEQLKAALEAAEVANRSKTDFLFNMSHDIRTPMNAITGFTRMAIRDINEPQKALVHLEKTRKAGDMLLSLINDILDMSRIESGHVTLSEQAGEVGGILRDIEPMMRGLATAKDIALSFSADDIVDRFAYYDSMRTQRILVNIISNAIKYTPAGGRVMVTCTQRGRDAEKRGLYIFTVEDNGIGMSDEFQAHLFEQFSREENTTTSKIQGTGLGLALCKSLTDLMGGTIYAVSKQGVGSTFTLTLPFRLFDENASVKCSSPIGADTDDTAFIGKHVLLVDDNELNREIASDILSESEMIVETAENGQTAIDMVLRNPAAYYDFILMDIQMPIMNGYEAASKIRTLVPERHIPIIALSANAFEEDKEKSRECGMDDHIAKPIDIEQLFAALKRFLV